MLDGLLGRGFSAKCKSSIKLIKARIDVIRRKRNAMQKFLKKDIADLLANNLDINAYGRADGLLVELTLSSCYDLVEQFCGSIPRHLSVMQKQSECPAECREAVASLIFAAARFSDLPELRDLRQMFTERYGNSLEPFVKPEFAEKLASNPPTKEMKLQLMRDIAKEFSVKWDSKDFEQKNSNPPASTQDRPNRHGSFHDRQNDKAQNDGLKPQNGNAEAVLKRDKEDNSSRGRRELTDEGYKVHNVAAEETVMKRENQDFSSHGRREITNEGFKPRTSKEATVLKRDNQEVWSRRRRERIVDDNQLQNGVEETMLKKDNHDVLTQGRREDAVLSRGNRDISSRGRREVSDDVDETIMKREDRGGRRELTDDGFNLRNGRKSSVPQRDNIDDSSHGRREQFADGYRLHGSKEDVALRRENQQISSYGRQEPVKIENTDSIFAGKEDVAHRRDNQHILSHGRREQAKMENTDNIFAGKEAEKVHEESKKPLSRGLVPPPYVRPSGGKYGTRNVTSEPEKTPEDPPVYRRDLNDRSERIHNERQEFGHARVNDHRDENEYRHQDDLVVERKPKPKPTSVRRRHLKPPPGYEHPTSTEDDEVAAMRIQTGRRREPRLGLQQALDEDHHGPKDEEEKMMDQLLMHYSKKPSKFESSKAKAGLNSTIPPLRHDAAERHQNRNAVNSNLEPVHRPFRAVSMPPEPVTPTTETAGQPPARATSLQPERAYVHPNLPEYDDLAARIASLRRRG